MGWKERERKNTQGRKEGRKESRREEDRTQWEISRGAETEDRWRWAQPHGCVSVCVVNWKVENKVLRASANRGNICRKMADVSSLIHNFYNIGISVWFRKYTIRALKHIQYTHTHTHEHTVNTEKERLQTATNTKLKIPEWILHTMYDFFSLCFILRFNSLFARRNRHHRRRRHCRRHRFSFHLIFFISLFALHSLRWVDVYRVHLVPLIGFSRLYLCLCVRVCVRILYISSTHKIHSLFISSPVPF